MLKLEDGMLLYHGSYTEVPSIALDKCKPGKDFGKGFYLTSSREQAHRFVPSAIRKHHNLWDRKSPLDFSNGRVSVYRFHLDPELQHYFFAGADADWLHFVAANRGFGIFPELLEQFKKYDIIAGKIANDKTATTINTYIDGLLGGEPGSDLADRTAIAMLIPERLADQYCFLSPASIASLEFVRSEAYDPNL